MHHAGQSVDLGHGVHIGAAELADGAVEQQLGTGAVVQAGGHGGTDQAVVGCARVGGGRAVGCGTVGFTQDAAVGADDGLHITDAVGVCALHAGCQQGALHGDEVRGGDARDARHGKGAFGGRCAAVVLRIGRDDAQGSIHVVHQTLQCGQAGDGAAIVGAAVHGGQDAGQVAAVDVLQAQQGQVLCRERGRWAGPLRREHQAVNHRSQGIELSDAVDRSRISGQHGGVEQAKSLAAQGDAAQGDAQRLVVSQHGAVVVQDAAIGVCEGLHLGGAVGRSAVHAGAEQGAVEGVHYLGGVQSCHGGQCHARCAVGRGAWHGQAAEGGVGLRIRRNGAQRIGACHGGVGQALQLTEAGQTRAIVGRGGHQL